MNLKLGGFLAVLFLAGVIYARHSGIVSATDTLRSQYADAIAHRSTFIADSVKRFYVQAFDSSAKAGDSVRRASQAKINQAARQTNQALDAGKAASDSAKRLLADSSATIEALRGALETDNRAIDSLSSTITAERLATTQARQADSTAHTKEVRLLREGFTVSLASKDSAARAVGKAFALELNAAQGHALRVGRLEGGLAGSLLVAGLVFLVKP